MILKFFWALIFLALLPIVTQAVELKRQDRDLVIILNLFKSTESAVLGNQDIYISQEIAYLEKRFPTSTVVYLHPETELELTESLEGLLGSTRKGIRALSVHAHGNSILESTKLGEDHLTQTDLKYAVMVGNNGNRNSMPDIEIHLNRSITEDPLGVDRALGAMVGKFLPNAWILFDSCYLLSAIDSNAKLSVMARFMDLMKIESGALYFNHTVGLSSFEIIAKQPYSEQQSSYMRAKVLTEQSWYFVTYPYIWFVNRYVANQGTLLVRSKINNRKKDQTFSSSYNHFLKLMRK